jgi:hypothetical protein
MEASTSSTIVVVPRRVDWVTISAWIMIGLAIVITVILVSVTAWFIVQRNNEAMKETSTDSDTLGSFGVGHTASVTWDSASNQGLGASLPHSKRFQLSATYNTNTAVVTNSSTLRIRNASEYHVSSKSGTTKQRYKITVKLDSAHLDSLTTSNLTGYIVRYEHRKNTFDPTYYSYHTGSRVQLHTGGSIANHEIEMVTEYLEPGSYFTISVEPVFSIPPSSLLLSEKTTMRSLAGSVEVTPI